ncbi:MAG: hypothetical protein ACRDFS_07195, partial [Chloroflexota bacterium]
MSRSLPDGMAAAIASPSFTPGFQVTLQDRMVRFAPIDYPGGGEPGRSSSLIRNGFLLVAVCSQKPADPQTVNLYRMSLPGEPASRSGPIAVTADATARAGCVLAQTGNLLRSFYTRAADRLVCYRDSGDDGQTWGAEHAISLTNPIVGGSFCYGLAAPDPTHLWAIWGAQDEASCIIASSTFGSSWSGWLNTGPSSVDRGNGYGKHRGISAVTAGAKTVFAGGAQFWAQLSALAHGSFSLDGSTYSSYHEVRRNDTPNLGLDIPYPTIGYDATSGVYFSAGNIRDDGSHTGSPSWYCHIHA